MRMIHRWTLACSVALFPLTAMAEKAGDWTVQMGGAAFFTSSSARPFSTTVSQTLLTRLAGLRSPFVAEGTSATVEDVQTAAAAISYFAGDHFSLSFVGGIPPTFTLTGSGTVRPPGVAGTISSINLDDHANQPAATATEWNPAVLFTMCFREPGDRLRPFVSLGVTYVFFTDEKLNRNLKASLENDFGRLLALAHLEPGPTHASASAEAGLFPVVNAGLTYRLGDRWGVSGSLTYNRTTVDSRIVIRSDGGDKLSETRTRVTIDTTVAVLFLTYRFWPR
ncbi:MAG: OmpW/AlkL family protein [Panacagrimonas sp.]